MFAILFVIGVVLLALLPLLMLMQVHGVLPWVLVLTDDQGGRTAVPVAGTRRMMRERRRYRALKA